ncbi:MAG: hypothetical protein SVZ03_00955 [Spirochaetota bacterium]|nr:hypothetical protein [Spirochaetota bacterium]
MSLISNIPQPDHLKGRLSPGHVPVVGLSMRKRELKDWIRRKQR